MDLHLFGVGYCKLIKFPWECHSSLIFDVPCFLIPMSVHLKKQSHFLDFINWLP